MSLEPRQGYYPRQTIPGDIYWYKDDDERYHSGMVYRRMSGAMALDVFCFSDDGLGWRPKYEDFNIPSNTTVWPAQDDQGQLLAPPGPDDVLLSPVDE